MIDPKTKQDRLNRKEQVRRRMRVEIDPDKYIYIPAKKPIDYYDNDVPQRVAIYVRVSTDDIRQTTSYELQKIYYEDFVRSHPNWTLVKIYADEGISGTSLKHRDAFNEMIADCRAGKIDLIITKSVSRFARNVMITIGMARELSQLKNPVGIFFESEAIFSLNDDSQMALTFQATMAEEESHTRSRSMETSLKMRLDNGIPLTPKLLGYTHDAEGHLVINPEEAKTVKLVFFMYLFGYTTQQISDTLIALERKSYLGNIKWTSGAVVQILRNERHCGDVLTRKTFTQDYRSHRKLKNRGERAQSVYLDHHEAIISRDDFIAVQRMLDNAKYGNRSILPELRVIDSGILKGFVSINPRWAGFKEAEYYQASQSVYEMPDDEAAPVPSVQQVELAAGDFDLRGFEVARSEFFDAQNRPYLSFSEKLMKFSVACARKFDTRNTVELLINPVERKFAVRPTDKSNKNSVIFSHISGGKVTPKCISTAAFRSTIYSLMGWNQDYKYRILGTLYEQGSELAYIFNADDSEVFFRSNALPVKDIVDSGAENVSIQPFLPSGKRIRAIPKEWAETFGKPFYAHEMSLSALAEQDEQDWKLRMQGQLFETGKKLDVTPFQELRSYIRQELSGMSNMEARYE
ncbi:MAG: recombinase family protein [Oscillospiraceae bacterium]|nr:recombinase family protein [Oscillospiraceae bacterium]